MSTTTPSVGVSKNKASSLSLSKSSSMSMSTPAHIVIVGGGIQGTSVAYHLAQRSCNSQITILESIQPASAASGKGGGFMARSWGDGTPTQQLHELAFDMYKEMAHELQCTTYRTIPVLSVSSSHDGLSAAQKNKQLAPLLPSWLDGTAGRIQVMGAGHDTAQITPAEFVHKMLDKYSDRIQVVLGACTGIETDQGSERGSRKITGVMYQPTISSTSNESSAFDGAADQAILPTDVVVISAGPWSCAAEDWFHGAVKLPMEGIKSTSIVWKKPTDRDAVDATALFCGEDHRFGTHLEVYPRPDGTIYICGIGGSDYITSQELKQGAFRERCDPNTARVEAAKSAFQTMSASYRSSGELERTQACMRPCPPDAMPYMGSIPGYEGAYINAGHNCWGIAWAPACGKAMSELILDGSSKSINLQPFRPDRFTPAATKRGTRGRKKRGTDVGEQW